MDLSLPLSLTDNGTVPSSLLDLGQRTQNSIWIFAFHSFLLAVPVFSSRPQYVASNKSHLSG